MARLTEELFRAIATNDKKRHDELAAEVKALDSDPTQRALVTRSNETENGLYAIYALAWAWPCVTGPRLPIRDCPLISKAQGSPGSHHQGVAGLRGTE